MAFLPFEDLKVFQLAEQLADEIWDIVITWKYFEKITLGQQWVDAADSVGANIAEGSGRGGPPMIINGLSEFPEALSTRLNIGCVEPKDANWSMTNRLQNCSL